MSTTTEKTLQAVRSVNRSYAAQLIIAASAVVVWSHADHYGDQALSMANRLSGGFLCAGLLILFGRRLIADSVQCQHARPANRWGYLLVLAACGMVAAKSGNFLELAMPPVALLMTVAAYGTVVHRHGDMLLPTDPRGEWQPIHENAFRYAWEDLTRDRVEALLQDNSDPRMTLWSLPVDITGEPYDEPLPFTACLGPLDDPFGFYRFVLTTARQEADR
jgi:hypothetical protein